VGWGAYQWSALALAGAVAGSTIVAGALSYLRADRAQPTSAAVLADGRPHSDVGANDRELPVPMLEDDERAGTRPQDAASTEKNGADIEPVVGADEAGRLPTSDEDFSAPGDDGAAAAEVAASVATPPPLPTPPGAGSLTEAPPSPPVAEEINTPRLQIDPLELDPEGLDLSTLLNGPVVDPHTARNLETVGNDEPASASEPLASPLGEPPLANRTPVRRSHEDEPAPASADVLLARRLPAVEVDGMALCRFLEFAGELSALPVSVAPEELRLAAVSAESPVSVEARDATIEEVLSTALKPLRLSPVVEGSQIVLRRQVADHRALEYPIGDLVADDAEAKRLAAWVQDLVAPETWQVHGGAGRLSVDGDSMRIDHTERIGFETIMLLERYRLARGLAPRSKYPVALLTIGPAGAGLAERLETPATFTFSHFTPLREIFRYWREELDAAVLVDWPAVADEQLGPHTSVTARALDQPWQDALIAVLAPLGLGWHAVDGRTIEITAMAKLAAQPELAVYPLAAGGNIESAELLAQVGRLAGENGGREGAASAIFDAEHRVLMVRQPASVQLALSHWLAEQKLLSAR
jgi:hypothetical protein